MTETSAVKFYTKDEIIAKTMERNNWTGLEVRQMLATMTTKQHIVPPTKVKPGDVFTLPSLGNHRCIVLSVGKEDCTAVMLTTNEGYVGVLSPQESRFLKGYITHTLHKESLANVSKNFIGVYDNPTHFRKIKKELKEYYKKSLKIR